MQMTRNKKKKVIVENQLSSFVSETPFANSTHGELIQKGFCPTLPLTSRKILKVSEEGKQYILNISNGKKSECFQVDGDIIKTGERCDKLILVQLGSDEQNEEWAEIFVELKGVDVKHAWRQLLETVKNQLFVHPTNKERRACVVAASFPSYNSNPDIERLKKELNKMKITTVSRKSNQPDNI